jgi:hypothetical protein
LLIGFPAASAHRRYNCASALGRRLSYLIEGIGKHPSNNWPGEVSVLGLNLEAAKSLARHYEQHAFVWAAGDGAPKLIQP